MFCSRLLRLCWPNLFSVISVVTAAYLSTALLASQTLLSENLDGQWRFALDRQDAGVRESWFQQRLSDTIRLPGSLPAQGIGDDISVDTPWTGGIVDRSFFTAPAFAQYRQPGQVKVPFWLQPEKYYVGVAWYQRDLEIPADFANKRLVLFLERPHWETRVWLDGQCVGTNLSLSTPHEYDLGSVPSGSHTLAVRVDNRLVINIGHDSHSVSDHTQGNWNGIVGRIELRATPRTWIDELQLYPDGSSGTVSLRGWIGNSSGRAGQGTLVFRISSVGDSLLDGPAAVPLPVTWDAGGGRFTAEVSVPNPKLWDEFHPALYRAVAELVIEQGLRHQVSNTFGFRDFATRGTRFVINGQETFIRGTLECCIFPKTGHPPTDVDSWRQLIQTAKAHGLNNLRFHSWCPPEAAFQAGDELGMYFHVECSTWANASTTLGDGKPVDAWVYQEADRILRSYGNHPSFMLMLYGNEPGGDHHKAYLSQWVTHYRAQDSRRLYSSGAGWPQLPENQFHVTPDPRIQSWGAGLKSRINALPPETTTDYREYIEQRSVPVISHEIGQWCVYPNFDEMPKYTGYLKPRNFEIFQETLAAHHLASKARPFLLASGKLQTLCYKEEIESALRTPGMGGFQLLDLHDFPGQGTALVGVLDPFWESKGYVTAAEYHRFCGATVPLARLPKRVFTSDEIPVIPLELVHFGPETLSNVWPVFKLVADDGRIYCQGHSGLRNIPLGGPQLLQDFRPILKDLPAPARYKLTFGLAGTPEVQDVLCENDWDLWVYPSQLPTEPRDIQIVTRLDTHALDLLTAGGRILWLLPPTQVAPDPELGKVALGFSSIFWNTAWTHRQAPHTLGILCNPKHPLFASFPTDSHSNWQWWYLVTRAGAMILDHLPPDMEPTVQVIDDWFTARKLGLLFEAKVGRGKLVVCSIDLNGDLALNPVTRQFRSSLLTYMSGDQFSPRVTLEPEALRPLIVKD